MNSIVEIVGSINAIDENGLTPLHWASASEESENLVPILIGLNTNILATDINGRSPLYSHCARGRLFGAVCILQSGADINCQSKDKSTALHYAAASGNDEIVKLLLAYGARTNIKNTSGLCAHEVNNSSISLR